MTKKEKNVCPLGKKLASLIRAANYDYIIDFERASGVRPDSIRRLIGGYTKSLPAEDLVKVASTLKMTVPELFYTGDGESISTSNLVPGSKNPCWFQIRSDEMAPTYLSGELVLVDTGIKSAIESGVYLVGNPSASAFRRISFNPINGMLHIDVDNKSYNYGEDISVDDLKIEGKVIGLFKRV